MSADPTDVKQGLSPFPSERRALEGGNSEPMWDPWKGPAPTSFWGEVARSPFTLIEGLGSGAAKGEAVLGGLLHEGQGGFDPENKVAMAGMVTPQARERSQRMAEALNVTSDTIQADARDRVKAMTPDATTTGLATQLLHGVSSGLEQIILGSLAGGPVGGAAAVGAGEGVSRYQELKEAGVDPTTALESGLLAGATSGAGAILPAAYGSTLLTRVLTGIAGNTTLGIANRYTDHAILEHGGYPEMAEQQRALDTTQILVDAALGATFGVLHHAGAAHEDARDPALAANLALRDRAAAPGVPVDPGSAGVHQAALEKAVEDVLQGKPVDVSETGIERAKFLERPTPDTATPLNMMASALKESGFLDEEANLRDLEEQFATRRGETVEPAVPRETQQAEKSTVLTEKLLLHEPLEEVPKSKSAEVAPVESVLPKEDWRDELGRHFAEAEAKRGPRWYIDGKPVWDMTPEEMDTAREKLRQKDTETLAKAFDSEEAAGKFQKLADSSSDSAYNKATKMMDALTPEKRAIVEAWERGEGGPNVTHEELYRLANNMRDMRGADTPEQLANQLKYAITKLGDKTDPHLMDIDELTAAMELKEGHRVATENGWNTKDLSNATIRLAAQRFSDPNDAEFMLRRFIKGKEPTGEDAATQERPNLMIPDENGKLLLASDALEAAKPDTDYPKAIKAATDCFARRGA